MARLLHIAASPREGSCSARVAGAFLSQYRRLHPQDGVETLDVFQAEIPPFVAPQAKAKYAVLAGRPPASEAEVAWQGVIRVVNHFKGFDKYLLSCPMWNFSIPYRLKQYIDVIVQPGLTVSYAPGKGFTGLVTGRPLMLILSRGGAYEEGDPRRTYDFQESYLRCVFGFIGFTDVRAIHIQGTQRGDAEQVEADTRKAMDAAATAAAAF
ncbi:MAG TPA: NAD(P)H-dependent oxidoreductase [Phycisphaerae bacterium]|nr:NAD(P)H-dependent oxidoreductase [Phycisphaerae bacterium]